MGNNTQMQHEYVNYGIPQHHQNYYPQQRHQNHYHQQQQQNCGMMPHGGFMFNANADIFVPRNGPITHQDYNMPQQHHYYGAPQHHAGYQGYGTSAPSSSSYNTMLGHEDPSLDAFAQFGQQSQQYMPSKELCIQIQDSRSQSLLNEIQVGCEQLISEGEEDSTTWISAIRQRFQDPKIDEESKKTGTKLIVEMAYSMEPNQFKGTDPQNTFSNLLKNLSEEIKDFLRQSIIPVIGEFHQCRTQLENDSRVYLAVFYAELFVKLTLENGSRIDKIGEALCDQIDEILKFPKKDEYMKCLLRAFKVAGAELDSSENLRKRVDQILTIMGGFANGSPVLGESVKAQVLSLIDCRQRGWDRVAKSGLETSAASYSTGACEDSFDESVDNDLTEEERQFLESHLAQASEKDDEAEDQELMQEFGKFVKEELLAAEVFLIVFDIIINYLQVARTAELMGGLNANDENVQDSESAQAKE
uniref:MIF4G domain-containing protein n=1 Tax=Caenorhabditis japonica TaxID=281687 RepID=A0A8R1HL43_CAEJA